MQTNRLFFAIVPNSAVRDAIHLAARDLNIRMQPGGRSVPIENYHATLVFLGSHVSAEQETGVRQAASLLKAPPFKLTLDVASSFPEARVWWLGAHHVPDELVAFREDLHRRVVGIGLPPDRAKYTPHVTVIRTDRKLPRTMVRPIDWPVTEFALMRSRIGSGPPAYEVVSRWDLSAERRVLGEQVPLL